MTTPLNGDNDPIRHAARVQAALQARINHKTWTEAAQAGGYASKGAAYTAVSKYLREQNQESATEYRHLQNLRLDEDAAIVRGILHDQSLDVTTRLRAADTAIRLQKRHADLNGLDAPKQFVVSSSAIAALHDALATWDASNDTDTEDDDGAGGGSDAVDPADGEDATADPGSDRRGHLR